MVSLLTSLITLSRNMTSAQLTDFCSWTYSQYIWYGTPTIVLSSLIIPIWIYQPREPQSCMTGSDLQVRLGLLTLSLQVCLAHRKPQVRACTGRKCDRSLMTQPSFCWYTCGTLCTHGIKHWNICTLTFVTWSVCRRDLVIIKTHHQTGIECQSENYTRPSCRAGTPTFLCFSVGRFPGKSWIHPQTRKPCDDFGRWGEKSKQTISGKRMQ